MTKLEDLLWGNEELGQSDEPEVAPAAISHMCLMICCVVTCEPGPTPTSTMACK